MYNEASTGNLGRCLSNLRQYCDDIVIYDDCSTDCSAAIASKVGHVIRGAQNDQIHELAHKQAILEYALDIGATHLFWLDCDEVLDRAGTDGGLRALCEAWPDGVDAYNFREVNLWRGERWARTDTLFAATRFVRLWRVTPSIHFNVRKGVHMRLYPATVVDVAEAVFDVLHFGFSNYLRMLEKIGAHKMTKAELHNCAMENWILDERNCNCFFVPEEKYPAGVNIPVDQSQPLPRPIEDLVPSVDLWKHEALVDHSQSDTWGERHHDNYHGTFNDIHQRNDRVWNQVADKNHRLSLFEFDPMTKVVIDIGCGVGHLSLDCLRAGASKVICLEVNQSIIDNSRNSFIMLKVPESQYEHKLVVPGVALQCEPADIIFAVAFFQHLPYQSARVWLRWIAAHLKPGGEAHLQFHRQEGYTTFADNEQNVSTMGLEADMTDAGLEIVSCLLADAVLPVWWIYRVRLINET